MHKYAPKKDRDRKNPPLVSLRGLRTVSGLTLDQVCDRIKEVTEDELTLTKGALSAIESGLRGASSEVLSALATAYGLPADAICTDYELADVAP